MKRYVQSSEDMSRGVMMDSGRWLEPFQSEKNLNIVSHLTWNPQMQRFFGKITIRHQSYTISWREAE
jgi:hypothetical protein